MIVFKLLLIAAVYAGVAILLAWFLAHQFHTPRAKAIAAFLTILIFALIPTWDILPGRLYFNHLCETEGGLKIYKTVEGVVGFYGKDIGSGSALHFLKTINYSYVEGEELGQLYRYTLNKESGLSKTEITQPIAPYVLVRKRYVLPLNVTRYEEIISRANTKEVIATKTDFYFAGAWIQARSSPVLGGGEYCNIERVTSTTFLENALKPRVGQTK